MLQQLVARDVIEQFQRARGIGWSDVGGVGHDHASGGKRSAADSELCHDFLCVGRHGGYVLRKAGGGEDALCGRDSGGIYVGGDDAAAALTCAFGATVGFVQKRVPGLLVMQAPAHKAPAFTQEARSTVEKLLSRLEHQAAARAAGVNKDKRACALGVLIFCGGLGT